MRQASCASVSGCTARRSQVAGPARVMASASSTLLRSVITPRNLGPVPTALRWRSASSSNPGAIQRLGRWPVTPFCNSTRPRPSMRASPSGACSGTRSAGMSAGATTCGSW